MPYVRKVGNTPNTAEASGPPEQPSRFGNLRNWLGTGVRLGSGFVANAGGVISSYAEYRGYNPKKMFKTVQDKIIKVTKAVLKKSIKEGKNPRDIAFELAKNRILEKAKSKQKNKLFTA